MDFDKYRSRRVYSLKRSWWMLALAVILPFVFVSVVIVPNVRRSHRSSAMATTTHDAKMIHLALFEFDQDYGEFPCDATAKSEPKLREYYGVYSNDYLGQLLASGIVETEDNFSAQGVAKLDREADDDFSTKEKTLEAGECGFAYVKGLSVESFYKTPLLLSPMYGDGYKFNNEIYKGRALVLRVDGVAKQYKIDEDHFLMTNESRGFFQGGKGTVWGEAGFDSSNLCYAKYPYDFTESIYKAKWQTWAIGGLAVLGVILIFIFFVIRRRRSGADILTNRLKSLK